MKTLKVRVLAWSAAALLSTACGPAVNPSQFATSITTQDATWTWIDTPGAVCGNGNATGFGVSTMSDSSDLVIYFEGGGACRTYMECYVLKTASNVLTGYGSNDFAADVPGLEDGWLMTSRTMPNAPFADKNLAYVPYCTGDVHSGHSVITYAMARQPMHHMGGANAQMYLQRLAASMPQVNHVWLTGFSAGGLSTILNYEVAAAAFPQARIDILDDSGMAFHDAPPTPSWWKPTLPTCDGCAADLSLVHIYEAQKHPESRFAFMSYAVDSVLPYFYYMLETEYSGDLAVYTNKLDALALPNLHYFIVDKMGHGTLNDPNSVTNGISVSSWVDEMASDSNAWVSQKPATFR